MSEEENDERRIEVRDKGQVAGRIACLSVLVIRSQFETHWRLENDRPGLVMQYRKLDQWLAMQKLFDTFSPEEKLLMGKPPGTWTEDETTWMHWRSEACGMLLWAVQKLRDFPAFGKRFPPQLLGPAMSLPASLTQYADSLEPRPIEELEDAMDLVGFRLWRARTEVMSRQGMPVQNGTDHESNVARACAQAVRIGLIDPDEETDLKIDGVYLCDVDTQTYATAASTSQERHLALSWLCGLRSEWDEPQQPPEEAMEV
ncbi:MAG: DUF4272 domain-containing protein [Acidobacteriota bacterium]|nr:DUF4272 domain-containing protein [Acidobacteriota bacterium]